MSSFNYKDGTLFAEALSVADIAAQMGTPCYIYSRAAIEKSWLELDAAFANHPHQICYAVKANSNIAVLNLLARLGSGFDIVSLGELRRVVLAGGDPAKVVFSGVAKSTEEIEAALNSGVGSLNIESAAELMRIQEIAQKLNTKAAIGIRVNPNVDPQTHPYISTGLNKAKFGIPIDDALTVYRKAAELPNISVHSIACHIGSQITQTTPFSDALELVLDLHQKLANEGIEIKQLDLGGGLGIDYQGETPPSPQDYVASMLSILERRGISLPIAIEPGRYIAGNAGIMVTNVEYLKTNNTPDGQKHFAIVDAGMNDLLRPALYQAYHDIVPVKQTEQATGTSYDVVGPVCESADVLGKDRLLNIAAGELLAIRSAGAYSFVMANNYNSRVRPPEIMVDGDQLHTIRRRETLEELTQAEAILP